MQSVRVCLRSLRLRNIFPRCPPVRDLYWNSLWIPVDFSASGHPNSGILFSRIRIPCYTGSVLSDPLPICTYRNSLPYQYPTGTCIRILPVPVQYYRYMYGSMRTQCYWYMYRYSSKEYRTVVLYILVPVVLPVHILPTGTS